MYRISKTETQRGFGLITLAVLAMLSFILAQSAHAVVAVPTGQWQTATGIQVIKSN